MFSKRISFLGTAIFVYFLIIGLRLYYWQIIKSNELKKEAIKQTHKLEEIKPSRGKIYSFDNFPLVQNENSYLLSIYKPNLKEDLKEILQKIDQIHPDFSEENKILLDKFQSNDQQKWITLPTPLKKENADQLSQVSGLSFQKSFFRFYPEDKLASTLLGQLAKNESGLIIGYDGLEGYYNRQLEGKSGYIWQNKDAKGETNLSEKTWHLPATNGQDLFTYINRSIQFEVEQKLQQGIEKFQADSAFAIIMEPQTGGIIAASATFSSSMATQSAEIHNPIISTLFEPGSIFKPLVVSIALDSQGINRDFICKQCNQAITIGKYTINNWDKKFHPDSNLKDVIKNSDNIGMSYIIKEIGLDKFLDYYQKLGLNKKTGIDLQGEINPKVKQNWPEIDLATASFGQGIAITPILMLSAFNSIANDGYLIKPSVVKQTSAQSALGSTKPFVKLIQKGNKIFDQKTIEEIKNILEYSVNSAAIAHLKTTNSSVCAKSGTSQVVIKGVYSEDETTASYIGFSPCQNPKFTMLVTVKNPKTSPWGVSTAAPIWYEIADRLDILL